jgi:undecaprenyl-diphosphatase
MRIAREADWCLEANRWGAHRLVRGYFRTVSHLGDGAVWFALTAVVAVSDGARGLQAATQMALVGGIATVLYTCLKRWARRPRPFAVDGRIRAWVAPLDEFSFPSGHTLHAVGFSLSACLWYPWLGWLLVPFAVSVAASRVVLGMHYPSDVLAAATIGAALAEGVAWVF